MNPKVLNAIKEAKMVRGKPDLTIGMDRETAFNVDKKAMESIEKLVKD